MKNLTWPQVVILLACLAAPIVAYKLLDSVAAGAVLMGPGMIITFLLGRGEPPPPAGPSDTAKTIGFVATLCLCLSLAGCFEFLGPIEPSTALEKCRTDARAAYYVGEASVEEALAIYEACKKDAGI